ncbi:hypothetical protein [Deinococcus aluminii]|uniref:Uncharacterized protein n=1 Tax=Deinococcus aluminii TaxID=1656885 RepID=A0ABP9XG53_9DEIO
MNTVRLTARLRKPALITLVACTLAAPSTAHAQDLGSILGSLGNITQLLQSGGIMSMISMIPGLNFLAGVGPIMDIVKMIPGLDGLLGSIPGLNEILGLLGMSGGGNLGPLSAQINQIAKWITAAKQIHDTAKNIIRPTNFTDFVSSTNQIMRLAGLNKTFTAAQYQSDPQGVAQTALSQLDVRQSQIMADLARAMTPVEANAIREKAAALQDLKGRVQRNADNAEAQNNTQKLTKETQERAMDALNYSTDAAKALKDNKKAEDIMKMVGSAALENLRVSALNSAALTAAIANQTKIQVTQAETLGQMLEEMQRARLDKANAIARQLEDDRLAAKREADRLTQYSKNLNTGISNSMSGSSLRGVNLLGGPQ